jgi:uncharacterized membrane protein YdjX (TVP38/TMEM64 family)
MSTLRDIDREGRRTNRRRLFLGFSLVAAFVFSIWLLPLDSWLVASRSWVAAHAWTGALLFVAAFVLLTIAMVPGSVLLACGGYLFGLKTGLPLASISAALGAAGSALLARTLARDWLYSRFENDARFKAINKAVARKGFLIVSLTRLSLLMPYNLLNVIYGLSRIPLGRMTLATWLSMTPAVVLYTYLGSVAADVEDLWSKGIDDSWTGRAVLASGLLMIIIVTVVIHRTATRALRQELGGDGEQQGADG